MKDKREKRAERAVQHKEKPRANTNKERKRNRDNNHYGCLELYGSDTD